MTVVKFTHIKSLSSSVMSQIKVNKCIYNTENEACKNILSLLEKLKVLTENYTPGEKNLGVLLQEKYD